MYHEIMGKIQDHRYNFMDKYHVDILEICGEVQMNPDTLFSFMREAVRSHFGGLIIPFEQDYEKGEWKVYGLVIRSNKHIKDKDLKFVLK